jgi:hypothetical protein
MIVFVVVVGAYIVAGVLIGIAVLMSTGQTK